MSMSWTGIETKPAALLADQLAAAEELPQVLADLAPDDVPEALVILFDLVDHRGVRAGSGRPWAHPSQRSIRRLTSTGSREGISRPRGVP
jgi:hypothetical protein